MRPSTTALANRPWPLAIALGTEQAAVEKAIADGSGEQAVAEKATADGSGEQDENSATISLQNHYSAGVIRVLIYISLLRTPVGDGAQTKKRVSFLNFGRGVASYHVRKLIESFD